jgi:hypothetical protein
MNANRLINPNLKVMKKFTKFLSLMMTILLSSPFLIAQVNPLISVNNPKAIITQQPKELPSQQAQDLQALKGPGDFIPVTREGDSRLVGDVCTDPIFYGNVNGPSMNGNLVAGGNVWYTFTSPVNMMATVSLCGGSSMDTKLDIYTDCSSP